MKYSGLWTHQREALLAVGPLMRPEPIGTSRKAVRRFERMKLSARDFEDSEPQFTMRGIACQCKLQVVLRPPDLTLTTGALGVQFSYEGYMRTFLVLLGVLASLVSLLSFATVFLKGTDIQLIAAGVFGTMAAVCFGFSATLAGSTARQPETAADLARELLGKWVSMEESARDRLARMLIAKLDATVSEIDLSELQGVELRNRLSSLLLGKV